MKYTYLLIYALALCCFACNTNTQETESDENETVSHIEESDETKEKVEESIEEINEQDKILEIASAKLTFKYSGKWQGEETVWFDQFGNRVVVDQDIQVSEKLRQKVRLIWNRKKEDSFTCSYLNDAGEEEKTCQQAFIRPKDTELSMFAHGDESQLKYGYESLGLGEYLDKEATGWKSKSAPISGWVWKGIDLQYFNQGVVKEITAIEELEQIPEELLAIPEGFTMK